MSTALPQRGTKKRTLERLARTTGRFSSSFLSKKNKANFSSKIKEVISWYFLRLSCGLLLLCGKRLFQFQKAVNRRPIALCKIPHISMDDSPASNATNQYYKCWPVLVHCWLMETNPAFLPRLLPRFQLLHSASLRCLHCARVSYSWERTKHSTGSQHQVRGNTCHIVESLAGTVEGNRNINLDLREVNDGEILTRARAKFNWRETHQLYQDDQEQHVLPSCQTSDQLFLLDWK